jgi:hypothetical protein
MQPGWAHGPDPRVRIRTAIIKSGHLAEDLN